jgi:hypothetical protein
MSRVNPTARALPFPLPCLLAGSLAALLAAASFLPAVAGRAPLTESESSRLIALSLLPPSPDLVVWADYFALRKSDVVADLESRLDAVPEAAENYRRFVQETGLDPRQDTDQIMLSLGGTEEAGGNGFLLVARGRFAGGHLVDAAAAKGGSVITMPRVGVRIWTSGQGKSGPGAAAAEANTMALAQPDGNTLLFGSQGEVERAALVAVRAKSPSARGVRFGELLSGADTKAPLWAILNSVSLARRISSEVSRTHPDLNGVGALQSVSAVRLSAWAGKDVDLKVRIDARDQESAGLLADLLRGMLAAGKLAAKDNDPELVGILQDVSLLETGKEVEIKARIPASRLRPSEGTRSGQGSPAARKGHGSEG